MKLFARNVPAGEKSLEHQTAYDLLRDAVWEYAQIPLPTIERDEHGKPFFADMPEIQFNLSHCRGLAVCGIGRFPLGVDAEAVHPLRSRVMRRAFSPEEADAVQKSENPDETFFRLWTLKESYVKALGVGVSYPMRTVCFRLENRQILSHPDGWAFREFQLGGIRVACCFSPTELPPTSLLI